VSAEPAAATLLLDGAPIPNPFDGKFERSEARHRVEASLAGFRSEVSWITFDADRDVAIKLVRGHGKREERAPAAAAAPAPSATRHDSAYHGTHGKLITDFPEK
jgi:hypothetical protein